MTRKESRLSAEPDDSIFLRLQNQRDFIVVTDVTVWTELHLGKSGRGRAYVQDQPMRYLCLPGRNAIDSWRQLDGFHCGESDASGEMLIRLIREGEYGIEDCQALFLFRYCTGGQRYLTRFRSVPLLDVVSKRLKHALVAAANGPGRGLSDG
jgi:hypothetical protein